MGTYLNPGKRLFEISLNSQIYVDKTELVVETNALVNTEKRFLCVSRPRRFGKSMTASMLTAYYGRDDDSRTLFEKCSLAKQADWDRYLGKFDVIRVVMTSLVESACSIAEMCARLKDKLAEELTEKHSDLSYGTCHTLADFFARVYSKTNRQFVFVIDEWDAAFRERPNDLVGQREYLDFLRNWFKDQEYVALAYMTGILPVKKYGRNSALNMFDEYSMLAPLQFAPYTGFTSEEVEALCRKYGRDYQKCQEWYNGYQVCGTVPPDADHSGERPARYALYAPLSVVNAIQTGYFRPYWNNTETYEALAEFVRMDFDGLKESIAMLMQGASLPVSLATYQNDMTNLTCRDDVLALLIHLGYLGYDQEHGKTFIPNREVHEVFETSTQGHEWSATFRAMRNSRRLLAATEAGDVETIAELIEDAHDKAGNRTYHSEAALSYAIQLAYYAAQDEYTMLPELDTGKGYADLAYLPKNPGKPAILIELKYDQSANTAVQQILNNRYPARLEQYKGNLILVGINYDRQASPKSPDFKHHSCQVSRA